MKIPLIKPFINQEIKNKVIDVLPYNVYLVNKI